MNKLIVTTSMAALLVVAGTAMAQTTKGEGGASAPSVPGKEGPATTAPSTSAPKAQRQEAPSTQKGASDEKGGPAGKSVQKGNDDGDKGGVTKSTQSQKDLKDNPRSGDAKVNHQDQKSKSSAERREDKNDTGRAATSTEKSTKAGSASGASEGMAGSQPNANVTVNVSPEKKREVTTVFAKYRGQAVANVNVRTTVGVAVTRTITLVDVPQDIVLIVPEYRRYRYFIFQDVVCIVDPDTYVIVDVIRLT